MNLSLLYIVETYWLSLHLLVSPNTTTTETSVLVCCQMHLIFFTLFPPAPCLPVPYVPLLPTWCLMCAVRWSHRKWDIQSKTVRQTVQVYIIVEHYNNIYVSQMAFMSNRTENIKKRGSVNIFTLFLFSTVEKQSGGRGDKIIVKLLFKY